MKIERVLLKITSETLAFAITEDNVTGKEVFESYAVKSGRSIAANLREAFTESEILMDAKSNKINRAVVLLDTPVLLVPMDEYNTSDEPVLFKHAYPQNIQDVVLHQVMAELNSVAVYGINKDLKMVITDNFQDVRIHPLMMPVWIQMYHQSIDSQTQKIYAYFHDKKMEVFSFQKSRFRFSNNYNVRDSQDATYFILYVWQQLGLNQRHDELYLSGTIPEDTRDLLHRYLSNVFICEL